jgi:hypothetical protein
VIALVFVVLVVPVVLARKIGVFPGQLGVGWQHRANGLRVRRRSLLRVGDNGQRQRKAHAEPGEFLHRARHA